MAKSKQEWKKNTLQPMLNKNPESQKFETSTGMEVETVYTPEDLPGFDYNTDLGYPGEYPFTRGVQANMYRGRPWTMRQYAGFGTAPESNKRFKWLLEHGQTGLSVAFDLPTQIGYDSDHPLAKGEVGRVGVAIDSLRDMEVMFDKIPLDKISTSMTVNATSNVLLAMYVAVARKQGVSPALLQGTTQNDVLKEYIARGTYAFPAKPSMRLIADSAAYCSQNMPKWNYINIAGYHMREAGATAAQEIGFTMADAIEYVRTFKNAGLDVDSFAPRISWIFEVNNNFLEEVAKFRALRRIWARIMKEKFQSKDPRSWAFRTHIQTGGVTLTAQQPRNNTIRATIQALAAVLGGVQSMAVSCYDEAIGLPTEESQLTSLRIQQIIASESGAVDTVDPLGGSYYIEYLTNKLEAEANEYIDKIEKMGGAAAAIEQGYQQHEIVNAAYRYQREIEEQKRIIVGVNKFTAPSPKIERSIIDEKVEPTQLATLSELKKTRDAKAVEKSLKHLKEACKGTENTMPVILEAVESYATLGEICETMRGVFGTQKASDTF